MAYTEIRNIGGKNYYYRVVSVRKGSKVSKKRVYLGCDIPNSQLLKKERMADERLVPRKSKKTNKELEKIRYKITKVLKRNNVKRAGIFGSYSRGEQRKDSDIDIAVDIEDRDMSLLGFARLARLLGEALNKKVDLVEYSAIKPKIKGQILKEEFRII